MKLGRLPARYTTASFRRAHIMARALAALGTPPANSDDYVSAVDAATGGDWGMMANDDLGDCTCADCGHQLMLRTANASSIVIPTRADIIALYSAITGYTPSDPNSDQGADELTVCEYMKMTGLLGHKTDAYANLDPVNLDHLKWGTQLYGCVRLGINFPGSAMDQFNAGQSWDVVAGATIEGGHDVPLVSYTSDGHTTLYFVVTWGKLQPVTEAFLKWQINGQSVVEEAHVEPSDDFLKATGVSPSGLDHAQLLANLAAVSG